MKKTFFQYLSVICSSLIILNSNLCQAASQATDEEAVESESVITVTAKPYASEALTAPQSVAVVQGRELDRARGQTAAEAIKDTPGVALLTTGAGISKPVIRGLQGQRVVIVQDGVRTEVQQWGDEHGTQINPFDIGRVEVLRGPNSLLYGSDALGGVVAYSKPELPDASRGAPKLGGKIYFDGYSNNSQTSGGLSLFGAGGPVGYMFNFSGRNALDYKIGGGDDLGYDKAWNSAFKDLNASGTVGVKKDWGEVDVDYGHIGQRIELTDEDPTATPYQKLRDDNAKVRANIPVGTAKIEASGAFEQNRRQEFETEDSPEASLELLTKTSTFDLKLHHPQLGPVKGTIGATSQVSKFETLAEDEKLIPSYDSKSFGGFIYEELPINKLTFTAGVRGDTQKMDIKATPDTLATEDKSLNYNQVTGAVGAVWHLLDPLAFAVNLGRGWRAPVPFELFASGVHEGTGRFELGNPDLKPEKSTNVDVATRYSSKRIKGEIAAFKNKISDYIFVEPTGTDFTDPDTGDVFPIFQNTQADATLTGGEASVEAKATDWLVLLAGYNVVRGKNDKTDENLPFIPADNFKGGVRFQTKSMTNTIDHPYFGVEARAFRKQDRVASNETPTPGYTLWNVSTGGEVKIGSNPLTVDVGVNNLTDKRYHDHLSRNFLVAGVPDQGRNFFVKLSMPFGIIK